MPRATIEDSYCVPENGKAELINGELVRFMPTGSKPSRAAGKIYVSLSTEEEKGGGYAYGDNTGFWSTCQTVNRSARTLPGTLAMTIP